jgi:polysaccharide export outer membrane protein
MRSKTALKLVGLLILSTSCSTTGKFVWADDLQLPADNDKGYLISPGDVLGISVWNQDRMSSRARVRADGRISVAFVNDVLAAGRTPADLSRELEEKLKSFILNPVVTVTLEEVRPLSVSVVGEVVRPGTYALETGAGVLQAVASAGGLTDYAHKNSIYVVRQPSSETRIRFRYDSLVQSTGRGAAFKLKAGDVVVVE